MNDDYFGLFWKLNQNISNIFFIPNIYVIIFFNIQGSTLQPGLQQYMNEIEFTEEYKSGLQPTYKAFLRLIIVIINEHLTCLFQPKYSYLQCSDSIQVQTFMKFEFEWFLILFIEFIENNILNDRHL